jgi:hypothetical protein
MEASVKLQAVGGFSPEKVVISRQIGDCGPENGIDVVEKKKKKTPAGSQNLVNCSLKVRLFSLQTALLIVSRSFMRSVKPTNAI